MLGTILKYEIDLGYGGRVEELKIVVCGFKIFYVGREEYLPRSTTSRASEGEHRFVAMTAPNQGFLIAI